MVGWDYEWTMSGLVFLFAVSGAVLGFTLKSIPSTLKHPRVHTPDLEVPLKFDNVISVV